MAAVYPGVPAGMLAHRCRAVVSEFAMAFDERDYSKEREVRRFEAWLRDQPSHRDQSAPDDNLPWWMAVLWWLVIALVIMVVVKRLL